MLPPHRGSQLPGMFGIESNYVVIITLDVHCRFPSWSVGIQPFDLILEAFENIARIQYFFEKPFFIFFIVRNYLVGPAVVLQIDNVLAGEYRVVLTDYRYIEDGEYTAFGQQFDNNRSEIDFGDKIKVDP